MNGHSLASAAVALGLVAALSACAQTEPSYGSAGAVRGSAYGAPDYDCRTQGLCGDPSNPIPGTNAIVGPGPIGEDWHKEPRE